MHGWCLVNYGFWSCKNDCWVLIPHCQTLSTSAPNSVVESLLCCLVHATLCLKNPCHLQNNLGRWFCLIFSTNPVEVQGKHSQWVPLGETAEKHYLQSGKGSDVLARCLRGDIKISSL